MVTKESESRKYCCFYVSEYHLEMILLPYIKDNIDKYKIIIYTQENLLETIKVLLKKINLKEDEKRKILNLNWSGKNLEKIDDENKTIVVINGDKNYVQKVNKKFKYLKNISVIDCYKVDNESLEMTDLKENYDEILNTKKI